VTFGGDFTRTCPLTSREWATTTLLGAVSLPVGVLMRFMPKPFDSEEDENGGGASGSCGGSTSSQDLALTTNEEKSTYEAFPIAAAALSTSASNFKNVMISEQRMKKVRPFVRSRKVNYSHVWSLCSSCFRCISDD